jgi:ectoine hydroxylase-related dioxygenase (phytanoyl-CoA dioxygenase family)
MTLFRRIVASLTPKAASTADGGVAEGVKPVLVRPPHDRPVTFADLSEIPDPSLVPPLDRPVVDDATLTPEQRSWRETGTVLLKHFVPEPIIARYVARREALRAELLHRYAGGWESPTPYEHVPQLREICLYPPLMQIMEGLVGEPMMLHLNLTGWVSTDRDWHQDDYLNPPFVNSWYAAVWIALDRIDPDSGPFEYVPGSHKWPLLRGNKVQQFLTEEERERREGLLKVNHWMAYAERFVTPAIDQEIARRNAAPVKFLGERGDVLIWHGRLMHRGSRANRPGMERRSLIAHYSGIHHRPDMPHRAQDDNGMTYAIFNHPLV